MSKRLLSHVSLSSLPRKLKSPRDRQESKTPRESLLGWSKTMDPLEKLMREASDPPESSAGAANSNQVPQRGLSRSGGATVYAEATKKAREKVKKDGSASADELELPEDIVMLTAEDLSATRVKKAREPEKEREKEREREKGIEKEKEKSPRKRKSTKKKRGSREDSMTDLLLSGGDVKKKRQRKTRRHVGGGPVQKSDVGKAKESQESREREEREGKREERGHKGTVAQPKGSAETTSAVPLNVAEVVRKEGSHGALSTRSSDGSDADEVLERTIRMVRSLSSYKFKRGASMDDILQDISGSDAEAAPRSRREDSNVSSDGHSGSSVRVTKKMTSLANQVTLGDAEAEADVQVDEEDDASVAVRKCKSKRKSLRNRLSLSVSSLDDDDDGGSGGGGGGENENGKGRRASKSPQASPRRAALANSVSLGAVTGGEDGEQVLALKGQRKAGRERSADSPILKRLSSALTWATRKTSEQSEDPEELEKFYQQKLKATSEVLESVHAAEMMAKRRYRQLQREERELLKQCEQLGESTAVTRVSSNGKPSSSDAPLGVTFKIRTDDVGVCEQIGRGASGTVVYRCIVDGWVCAMKELTERPGMTLFEAEREAFEKEMAFLYQLPQHPNIVRYLFHKKLSNQYCLFMALYDGTLRQEIDLRIAAGRLFGVTECTRVARDVAKGLTFLHKQQVLHRDIKCDNVFIGYGTEGELARVAIGDFDSAIRLGYSFSPGSCVGTPGFMAPEVMKCYKTSSTYSFEADVYSFGMLLYEMVMLKFPYYECKSPIHITKKVLAGEPPTISEPVENMYGDLVALMSVCIAFQPRDRPTMEMVSKRLEEMVEELSTAEEATPAEPRIFRCASRS